MSEKIVSFIQDQCNKNPELLHKKHCIYFGEKLKLAESFHFRTKSLELQKDESAILLICARGDQGGIAFTNFGLHFTTRQDGFFSPFLLMPKGYCGFINYEDLKSFQIAYSDKCYGTNYFGHNLVVNKEEMGLVRMGLGITWDEPVIKFINNLSLAMVENCLEEGPDLEKYPKTII